MGHVNEPIVNLPVVGNARNTRQKGLLTYLQHIALHTLRYYPIAIAIYHAPRLIPAGPFQLPIAIPIPLPNPFRHKNCEVINIALFSDGRKEKERQNQGERERERRSREIRERKREGKRSESTPPRDKIICELSWTPAATPSDCQNQCGLHIDAYRLISDGLMISRAHIYIEIVISLVSSIFLDSFLYNFCICSNNAI